MSKPLQKQPSESRLYTMNFEGNLASGETITGITSVSGDPAGLTISGQAIVTPASKKITFRVAGGTDGNSHKITAIVTTSASNTLEGECTMVIGDS